MKQSKRIAECGMMTALCVVIMIVGNIIGLGLYISPVIAGLLLLSPGKKYGIKYHMTMYLAVCAVSLLTVADMEQNLMFLCFFGCYPMVRPQFEKIGAKLLRMAAKLIYFNLVIAAVEALVIYVLVPETMGAWMFIAFMVVFNLTFVCYDFIVPRFELLLKRYLGKLK